MSKHPDGTFCGREHMRHQLCIDCRAVTCGSTVRIEEVTLKRRKYPTCDRCAMQGSSDRQEELREARTLRDWEYATDTLDDSNLNGGVLGEQLDGKAKRAIRAFLDADFESAEMPNLNAQSVESVIRTLSLSKLLYVETRGGIPTLRRAAKLSA